MREVKVQAPAKINLTLEVLDKREDGFHNIQSIMQAISLYDYLTIKVKESSKREITLSGNSPDIPYDSSNLIYKAAVKFLDFANINNVSVDIYIEKNILIAAGLAGGSTDAAAAFVGLNSLFNNVLSDEKINELCASLGSDLNFCLKGGCAVCTSRGEIIEPLPSAAFDLSLIKPKSFGISAKEAYTKFSLLQDKSNPDATGRLKQLLLNDDFDKNLLYNSLEIAVINDYKALIEIKNKLPEAMMSGSGPTFFVLDKKVASDFDREKFDIIENLKSVPFGVTLI